MSDPHSIDGSQHYRSFWDLTRASLRYTLQRHKLDERAANLDALMQQYAALDAFPENIGVLQTLKLCGPTTAILSNGSPDMLDSTVTSAGMTNVLDHVISVDTVRRFKTSPESYASCSESSQLNAKKFCSSPLTPGTPSAQSGSVSPRCG